MNRIFCLAVLVLAGCATNRAAMLEAQYRARDSVLAAPVGAPVLNGHVLAWNQSPEEVRAELPGVELSQQGDWLIATLSVEGHAATVSLGFGPRGLSRVTVAFLGEGKTLRETYAQLEPVLQTEYGEPERVVDAKEQAAARVRGENPLRGFADFTTSFAAMVNGDTETFDAAQADAAEFGAAIDQARASVPEYLETVWSGPAGWVALLANEESRAPLQMMFVPAGSQDLVAAAE